MPSRAVTVAGTESKSKRCSVVHVASGDGEAAVETLAEAVARGLSETPRTLPCRFFYDEAGSALFDQICELDEYYLTRTEDAILREHAHEMVDLGPGVPCPVMIELGSGSADKTRRLIAASLAREGRLHYVPIDVSPAALEESAWQLASAFSRLRVTGYVADYLDALEPIMDRFPGPRLLVFLGSSLGNYEHGHAVELLSRVARVLGPDDRLLLGTDMAKDASVLEPAYDDALGVTAQFNRNLLVRINRELGANFAPERFAHRAVYRPDRGRVEMHLVSLVRQAVRIPAAELTVLFEGGETIHTENSHKYTPEMLTALAGESGFVEESAWTDPRGWFRVQRWRPSKGA